MRKVIERTVSVTKRVQEQVYEPFEISVSSKLDVYGLTNKQIEEVTDSEYLILLEKVEDFIYQKLEEGTPF